MLLHSLCDTIFRNSLIHSSRFFWQKNPTIEYLRAYSRIYGLRCISFVILFVCALRSSWLLIFSAYITYFVLFCSRFNVISCQRFSRARTMMTSLSIVFCFVIAFASNIDWQLQLVWLNAVDVAALAEIMFFFWFPTTESVLQTNLHFHWIVSIPYWNCCLQICKHWTKNYNQ